jgi:hypothetical protein
MTQDGVRRYIQEDKEVTEGEKKWCESRDENNVIEFVNLPSPNPPNTR